MKHLRSLRFITTFCLLALFTTQAAAQVQTARHISTSSNSGGFYEYLPEGYYSSSESYPLIVFIHGLGELGDGSAYQLPKLLNYALPQYIHQGRFPKSFSVNGQTHKFIVVSPQFRQWPGPDDVDAVVEYAKRTYRVNTSRIYITGLSMGGGATWDYAGNSNFASKIAAIVPTCGASWPDYNRGRTIANANIAVWATHNNGDGTVPYYYSTDYIKHINTAPTPNPTAKLTTFYSSSHDSWTQTYDPNFRENNLNVYEWMLQFSKGSAPAWSNPTPTPAPTFTSVPAKIEAETFASMSGVQTETTSDAGGGQNIGYVDNGDWMDYNVAPTAAGNYTLSLRVASQQTGGQIQVKNSAGSVLATVTVPNTGGWQSWQTVTANVYLPTGNQTIRLQSSNWNSWNFNWLQFTSAAVGGSTPPATSAVSLPGKVEAEGYSNMAGVQKETTSDAGGGQNVGYIDQNDWMDYPVNVTTAGAYTVSLRVATPQSGAQVQVRNASGTVLGTLSLPNTGGWQSWGTATGTVNLPAGTQTLRIVASSSNNWNINWIQFASATSTPAPTSGLSLPGRIEAEAYSNMTGVQKETTADAGGGQNVGYIDFNDWMDYAVNVTNAGSYNVSVRVASGNGGGQVQIKNASGTLLGSINVPNTGGWQSWQTVTGVVNLPAGAQTIRIQDGAGNWNINWIEFRSSTYTEPGGGANSPIRVEAEAYDNMSGIQKENTADDGGGENIGYVDANDYMDYSVNVPSAGTYTFSFRVATQNNNAAYQVRNTSGNVLGTVTTNSTGGWQSWTTVTASVTLPAGTQTIRLVSTGAGANLNWFEISGNSVSTNSVSNGAQAEAAAGTLKFVSDKVTDRLGLKIANAATGKVRVRITDASGAVRKSVSMNKATPGASQSYLPVSELPSGTYKVEVSMDGWQATGSFTKL